MKTTVGTKVALWVVGLMAVALSVNAFLTPALGQAQRPADAGYLKATLTGVAPGTEVPLKIDISGKEEWTTSPDKETYTVDPSVQYSDLTHRMKALRLKGRILIEGKIRAEGR